jgi:hypothetical protein
MILQNASSGAPWQPLVQIGDINVDQQWVRTPSGSTPTQGVTWTLQDMTRQELVTPTYAIALAVALFMWTWFLSAFLLLIKVERTTGWIKVTAQGPAFVHATQIPASGPETAADVVAQVNYARSLTATAQQ